MFLPCRDQLDLTWNFMRSDRDKGEYGGGKMPVSRIKCKTVTFYLHLF